MLCRTLVSQTSIAVLLLTITFSEAAQQPSTTDPQARKNSVSPEAREQVRKVIPAIGLILVRNTTDAEIKPRPRGSAVIVHKDGLVVTNFHVVARDRSTKLYDEIYLSLPANSAADASAAPRQLKLSPVMTNQERDLALLKIVSESANAKSDLNPSAASTLPFVELAESAKIELLDDLFIIGFPEKGGTTVTVNYGVVEGKDVIDEWIKTDARIIHGNSGGAAVNSAGKLIGIPTRVVADSDGAKTYGSVGYLRPAHLVAGMIDKYREMETRAVAEKKAPTPTSSQTLTTAKSSGLVTLRGVVKSGEGKPLAGVRVGLLPVGQEIAASTLITWGGTDADGQFVLEKPVPPGRYNLRAKVIGYELYNLDLEITPNLAPLVIQLKASRE